MAQSLYNKNTDNTQLRRFTISVLTENRAGLLNRITIIFTRRKINIESLNVSESEIKGVHRYSIVIHEKIDRAEKVVKQIQKMVDVLGAFLYEDDDVYYQEIALYKIPTHVFLGGEKIERLVRENGARVLVIEEDHIVIEKTGHKDETSKLFEILEPHGVLEFVRSGRVAISKSKRKTEKFLEELETASTNTLNHK